MTLPAFFDNANEVEKGSLMNVHYSLEGVLVLSRFKDPEVAKLLADDTRRRILHFLRHHERSATDLAKYLNKSHSNIIHHLNLLVEAGLVQETRFYK